MAVAIRELARLVRLAAGAVAAIIGLGILFVVLDANPGNDLVSAVHDGARALVGPFGGMFKLHHAEVTLAVNWGIAALVYLVLGVVIARLLVRLIVVSRTARVHRRRVVAR